MFNRRLDGIFLRDTAILVLAGLLSFLPALIFQQVPGYMDAEYYFAGALNLYHGQGFFESYIWNTLNLPPELPAPSHTYWMPLPSILALAGMRLFSSPDYLYARFAFLVMALCIPVVTYHFAYRLSQQRRIARLAGAMAILCGVYLVYTSLVEAFTIYILLGGINLFIAWQIFRTPVDRHRKIILQFFLMGLLSGLMHLTRADGILWAGFAFLLLLYLAYQNKRWKPLLYPFLALLFGYGLVMASWYIRNMNLYGWLFPPGLVDGLLYRHHYL